MVRDFDDKSSPCSKSPWQAAKLSSERYVRGLSPSSDQSCIRGLDFDSRDGDISVVTPTKGQSVGQQPSSLEKVRQSGRVSLAIQSWEERASRSKESSKKRRKGSGKKKQPSVVKTLNLSGEASFLSTNGEVLTKRNVGEKGQSGSEDEYTDVLTLPPPTGKPPPFPLRNLSSSLPASLPPPPPPPLPPRSSSSNRNLPVPGESEEMSNGFRFEEEDNVGRTLFAGDDVDEDDVDDDDESSIDDDLTAFHLGGPPTRLNPRAGRRWEKSPLSRARAVEKWQNSALKVSNRRRNQRMMKLSSAVEMLNESPSLRAQEQEDDTITPEWIEAMRSGWEEELEKASISPKSRKHMNGLLRQQRSQSEGDTEDLVSEKKGNYHAKKKHRSESQLHSIGEPTSNSNGLHLYLSQSDGKPKKKKSPLRRKNAMSPATKMKKNDVSPKNILRGVDPTRRIFTVLSRGRFFNATRTLRITSSMVEIFRSRARQALGERRHAWPYGCITKLAVSPQTDNILEIQFCQNRSRPYLCGHGSQDGFELSLRIASPRATQIYFHIQRRLQGHPDVPCERWEPRRNGTELRGDNENGKVKLGKSITGRETARIDEYLRSLLYDEVSAEGAARKRFFKNQLVGLQEQLQRMITDGSTRGNLKNKLGSFLCQLTKYILEKHVTQLCEIVNIDRSEVGHSEAKPSGNGIVSSLPSSPSKSRVWKTVTQRVRLRVEEAIYMPLRRKVLHMLRKCEFHEAGPSETIASVDRNIVRKCISLNRKKQSYWQISHVSPSEYRDAVACLRCIESAVLPSAKLDAIIACAKAINETHAKEFPNEVMGADDFIPVQMFVLSRARLTEALTACKEISVTYDIGLTGEQRYYLTVFESAVVFLASSEM